MASEKDVDTTVVEKVTSVQPKPVSSELSRPILPQIHSDLTMFVEQGAVTAEEAELIRKCLDERTQFGVEKYGQPLHTIDGRDTWADAVQEIADLVQYAKKLLMECPQPSEAAKENVGDVDKLSSEDQQRMKRLIFLSFLYGTSLTLLGQSLSFVVADNDTDTCLATHKNDSGNDESLS